jgi:lycopene cyclase domain-containing protein
MTYALLVFAFTLPVLVLASVYVRKYALFRAVALTVLCMTILTAIFDSLIIATGIVAYDPSKILGWYVGRAPVEDFSYMLVASVAAPVLWKWYDRKN